MNENNITGLLLKAAFTVHSELGTGLLESSYKECLAYEMMKNGLFVEKEKPMPLVHQDVKFEIGYRIDLLVEKCVVVEIKTVEAFSDVH